MLDCCIVVVPSAVVVVVGMQVDMFELDVDSTLFCTMLKSNAQKMDAALVVAPKRAAGIAIQSYHSYDEWAWSSPSVRYPSGRVIPAEHRARIEETAMQLWDKVALFSDKALLTMSPLRGTGNCKLPTGSRATATGRVQQRPLVTTYQSLMCHERLSSVEAQDRMRAFVKVSTGVEPTKADVREACESKSGPLADFKFAWPLVIVHNAAKNTDNLIAVTPVTFYVKAAANGKVLMSRTALPLVSARCVKFSHTLGITVDASTNIFIDAAGLPENGSQAVMLPCRQADPQKVYLSVDFAIGPDMFRVKAELLAWFSADDWVLVSNPHEDNVVGMHQILGGR